MVISFTLPNEHKAIFPYDIRGLAKQFLETHYPEHNFVPGIQCKESLITDLDNQHAKYNESIVKKFFKIK